MDSNFKIFSSVVIKLLNDYCMRSEGKDQIYKFVYRGRGGQIGAVVASMHPLGPKIGVLCVS